jgi:hypothetical protein
MFVGLGWAFQPDVGRPPGEYLVLVWNNRNAAVAEAHSVDPERWQRAFRAVLDAIESRFARYEPLRHAAGLMLGMVSGLDRKNCWTIAEHRGDPIPDGLQQLLARARWVPIWCVMTCAATCVTRSPTLTRVWPAA